MLFREALLLSVLLTSVSAVPSIHPLLVARQNVGACQSQCALIIQKEPDLQSGACSLSCICTQTFVNSLMSCLNCLDASGQNLPGVPADLGSQLVNECNSAGFPVSGGSGGSGSGAGGLGGSGGSASTTGGDLGGSGGSAATTGGDLGGSGGSASTTAKGILPSSTPTSSSSSSGSSKSGGGLTTGKKNGAIGVSASMGVFTATAAAVVGSIFAMVA